MLPIASDKLLYPIGSISVFVKFIIPIPRNVWYILQRKISILMNSKLYIKKRQECTFPGLTSPTYSYKNFCYLTLGSSRILILGKKDDERVLFDIRHTFSHTEMRAILFFPNLKQINYGIYSRDTVIEKFDQVLDELEIKKFNIKVPKEASTEIVRVIPQEMTPFFLDRLIKDIENFEVIKGKFSNYQVKIINVSGRIVVKLISEPAPIDKITPIIDEAKRVLQEGTDIKELLKDKANADSRSQK